MVLEDGVQYSWMSTVHRHSMNFAIHRGTIESNPFWIGALCDLLSETAKIHNFQDFKAWKKEALSFFFGVCLLCLQNIKKKRKKNQSIRKKYVLFKNAKKMRKLDEMSCFCVWILNIFIWKKKTFQKNETKIFWLNSVSVSRYSILFECNLQYLFKCAYIFCQDI